MLSLAQPLASITSKKDPVTVLDLLVKRLGEFGIRVVKHDAKRAEVVARCLTLCANWGLWRCWSESLRFRATRAEGSGTLLDVAALPNPFRIGLRRGEEAFDVDRLLSSLRAL